MSAVIPFTSHLGLWLCSILVLLVVALLGSVHAIQMTVRWTTTAQQLAGIGGVFLGLGCVNKGCLFKSTGGAGGCSQIVAAERLNSTGGLP